MSALPNPRGLATGAIVMYTIFTAGGKTIRAVLSDTASSGLTSLSYRDSLHKDTPGYPTMHTPDNLPVIDLLHYFGSPRISPKFTGANIIWATIDGEEIVFFVMTFLGNVDTLPPDAEVFDILSLCNKFGRIALRQ